MKMHEHDVRVEPENHRWHCIRCDKHWHSVTDIMQAPKCAGPTRRKKK